MSHDVVVIGAGISGLVDAILLAETGRRVLVLEQHTIPGGYLQQFGRKGTTFDVGFHYMGSTRPGRPMRQFLEHLHIWDRLELLPFPDAEAIVVQNGARRFGYPSRWARFPELAHAAWPHEGAAIDKLVADVETCCAQFKWFDLKRDVAYTHPLELDLPKGSFAEHVDGFVSDPWLREVLANQTFNLGLFDHEIPWTKHALAFRSNFDTTSRLAGGGGALVDALVERGRELGVEYRFGEGVVAFDTEGKQVVAARTSQDAREEAGMFIAACHPKPVLRALTDEQLRPLFKERVLELKDSRGALQVFVRLKQPLSSVGAEAVFLTDEAERAGDPALHAILVSHPSCVEGADRGGPRLEAMTYLDWEPFAAWADQPVMRRDAAYKALKADLERRVLRMITAQLAPELPDHVQDVYSATPLTDAWYTGADGGAVFGISHDVTQQGTDRPMPRMRLRNLFFTGHSITMPGICGTFINAFDTCDMIRGDGALWESVAT